MNYLQNKKSSIDLKDILSVQVGKKKGKGNNIEETEIMINNHMNQNK